MDKDAADDDGWTALFMAAMDGHLAMVQYLVEQGADKDVATNGGSTPLMICCWSEILQEEHLEVASYLLEQGADRDKANDSGETPLHFAAEYGYLEIAMLLMSYGADLNARTNRSQLPIDVADDEEIKKAIRDEPRRRMDEAPGKRATDQDRHPNATIPASVQQEEEGEEQQSNKRPRLDEGATEAEVTKVAEEDEDSEPSSDEEEDD